MESPIDKFYKEVFGSSPARRGAALERLSAIIMYLLEKGTVVHDKRLRGEHSETSYQIDAHHKSADGEKSTVGESKDYSDHGQKVGRGDVQKLAGALPDLKEIDSGALFSATGFTKPAKKYAANAEAITGGKPISLYDVADSTEKDEEGLIKKIVFRIHMDVPNPHAGKFSSILTPAANKALFDRFCAPGSPGRQMQIGMKEFFDQKDSIILSMSQLTSRGYGSVNPEDNCASGCYVLPSHFVKIEGELYEILGIEYSVPHHHSDYEFEVTDDSKQRMVVRDANGKVLVILTDRKLQAFSFDADGTLIPPR